MIKIMFINGLMVVQYRLLTGTNMNQITGMDEEKIVFTQQVMATGMMIYVTYVRPMHASIHGVSITSNE